MGNTDIEKTFLYIEDNLDKPLTLAEVSQKCCMSKYHFTRVFKKISGRTFKEYHNEKRIEKAKLLLSEKSLRITEVCYEVGYNDISYFNRIFRRYVGMNPSTYRKQLQDTRDCD